MNGEHLILNLTASLAVALFLGYVTQRIGLSPIVGYLIAGIVVGPATPGFVADHDLAEQMAEIGVVLLMFGVGLHFHIDELLAVKRIAVPGAVGQSLVATGLGALLGYLFGWGWTAGIVFGLAISVASTVVLTRVLADNDQLHTPTGHIAVGWLIVEDLFTVLVLVLMPPLLGGGADLGYTVIIAAVKIVVLMVAAIPIGGRILPWLLHRVARTGSRELFTLTVLVTALGLAVGSAKFFGVSMALGAFLAGMIVGRSEFSLRAAADALPMRDAFAVLFFVSVGMMFEPLSLLETPGVVLATLAVVMIGKPLAALVIVSVLRYPFRVALSVAIALGQIGEFSFILAKLGNGLNVLPEGATSALVAVAMVSIAVNPLLFRAVGPIERWALGRPRLWRFLNARAPLSQEPGAAPVVEDPRYRAVVVGYGPVGQTLTRLLKDNGIEPLVIEMNLDTVRRLRKEGISAVYGDASHPETLAQAGVATVANLILTSSTLQSPQEVVRLARESNPLIRVIARSSYLREREGLHHAGADEVYAGEGEVALAMTESVLRGLGASPEQIDREREKVRTELIG